jgi:hypothetical protein
MKLNKIRPSFAVKHFEPAIQEEPFAVLICLQLYHHFVPLFLVLLLSIDCIAEFIPNFVEYEVTNYYQLQYSVRLLVQVHAKCHQSELNDDKVQLEDLISDDISNLLLMRHQKKK